MRKITPQTCSVFSNEKLDNAGQYFRLTVSGFLTSKKIRPGQFVHVKVTDGIDPFFRRAFSVADYEADCRRLAIIYKVVGRGTRYLANLVKGDCLDLIGPLGTCFSAIPRSKTVIMAAGGIGLPPLYYLAKDLVVRGHHPAKILFFYGGRRRPNLIELNLIRRLKVKTIPCTDDGSFGFHGLVTEAIENRLEELNPAKTVLCGCGPEPMLDSLQKLALTRGLEGEISVEAPMPCGVGVCLGCVKPLLNQPDKYVRVCHEGPVFKLGEVKI